MSKHLNDLDGRIELVGDTFTLYPRGRTEPIVARVLGTVNRDGVDWIYLDRLIHAPHQHHTAGGFPVSGAITTILHRPTSTAM